jgi:hypothetical protein
MSTTQEYFQEVEKREQAKALLKDLFTEVNGSHERELVEKLFLGISSEHRTLQASFWRILFSVMKKYGQIEPAWYDLRNEAAVKACKKLTEHIETDSLYIPFI